MDETGFTFGQGGSQRVLVPDDDPASWFKAQPDTRENATVIECIRSGGQVLPPLVITRGKIHTVGEQRQMEGIPPTWHFAKMPTGWTNNEIALQWATAIFDANTRPSLQSAWRLLILDGHQSRVSSDFLTALWSKRIVPLCLPPHATHVMQLLDVSIFAPLKAAYKRLVTELASHVPGTGIDKAAFGSLYLQACGTALTSAKEKKAFKDSGIMVSPSPDKVLAWLASSAAHHQSDSL
ncbi:hypothetical protein NDA16_000040 [Ustilago loliicola]|nr:hypothetical protein NDA16_000040 [Ustilago loliicola]